MKHSHYYKDVSTLTTIDVYRLLRLFNVTDPCFQHALKKILLAGGRMHKDVDKDVQDAIDTLTRWQGMRVEDQAPPAEIDDGIHRDSINDMCKAAGVSPADCNAEHCACSRVVLDHVFVDTTDWQQMDVTQTWQSLRHEDVIDIQLRDGAIVRNQQAGKVDWKVHTNTMDDVVKYRIVK